MKNDKQNDQQADEEVLEDWIAMGRPAVPAGIALRTVRALQSEQRHPVVRRWPFVVAGGVAAAAALLLWLLSANDQRTPSKEVVAMRPSIQMQVVDAAVNSNPGAAPSLDAAPVPALDASPKPTRPTKSVKSKTSERTPDSVLSTLSNHPGIRSCAPSQNDKWPKQKGQISFSISQDGSATKVSAGGFRSYVAACLEKTVSSIAFGPGAAGDFVVGIAMVADKPAEFKQVADAVLERKHYKVGVPLYGIHRNATCSGCHGDSLSAPPPRKKAPTSCLSCHPGVHQSKFVDGQCMECHTATSATY
jgi:hypothetical protein